MRPSRLILAALGLSTLALVAAPRLARADAQQTQSFAAWRLMQKCAVQAQKKFPDYTPEGNAQREAARQECLRANRLPPSAAPPVPPPH